MEDSQQKLNDAISTMAGTLHRNYLRRIYVSREVFLRVARTVEDKLCPAFQGDAFNCSYRCTEDPNMDPLKFNHCVEKCSLKISQAEQSMSDEMKTVQDRLMRCIRACEDKAKDSNVKDDSRLRSGFESCVVNCANEIQQLLPKIESRIGDQLKRF